MLVHLEKETLLNVKQLWGRLTSEGNFKNDLMLDTF